MREIEDPVKVSPIRSGLPLVIEYGLSTLDNPCIALRHEHTLREVPFDNHQTPPITSRQQPAGGIPTTMKGPPRWAVVIGAEKGPDELEL